MKVSVLLDRWRRGVGLVWFGLVVGNASSQVHPWLGNFKSPPHYPPKNVTLGKSRRKRQAGLGNTTVPGCIYCGREIWNTSPQILKR